jgi:putative hemolysin
MLTSATALAKRYDVRLAEGGADLERVLALRSQVFGGEYDQRLLSFLREPDPIDLAARHLLIEDLFTRRVVGSYRLFTGRADMPFASEEFFHIGPFLRLSGRKMELGRACVDPAYRRGTVLSLLWRGIMACAQADGARFLFGLASFKAPLKENPASRTGDMGWPAISVKEPAPASEPSVNVPRSDDDGAVPGLVRMYLKAGAQILSSPSYDPAFRCYDYFTALDLTRLNARFAGRYP